jgi:transcriptional regulator with XRE-family HTH domain
MNERKRVHGRRPSVTPSPTDVLVGKRLRYARQLAGLTAKDLAIALRIGERTISRCESGRSRLGATRLAAAATALGLPIAFFFEEDVPVGSTAADHPTMLTPAEAYIVRQFRTFEPHHKDEVLNLIHMIGEEESSTR